MPVTAIQEKVVEIAETVETGKTIEIARASENCEENKGGEYPGNFV